MWKGHLPSIATAAGHGQGKDLSSGLAPENSQQQEEGGNVIFL